jgi:hypothetical protein
MDVGQPPLAPGPSCARRPRKGRSRSFTKKELAMSLYEIGRDIQELRSRIERLEGSDVNRREEGGRGEWSGRVSIDQKTGVDFDKDPILWELPQGRQFPPFLATLFGYPPNVQFDIAPESKTWTCVPEPLIINVIWDTGQVEEHCRFSDQVFSIFRIRDPNSGVVAANAVYSARLTQRNGRSVDYAGGNPGSPYVPAHYVGPVFPITLRAAGGAGLFSYYKNFTVTCGLNLMVNYSSDFPPGLYDLVTGATWQLGSWRVLRC